MELIAYASSGTPRTWCPAACVRAEYDDGVEERNGVSGAAPAEHLQSVVQRLFGGELASTVVCGDCGHSSTAIEPIMCDATDIGAFEL